ncbi:MAG TPA: GtrA family protein [Puia sp.]|jgi:putative flippase GtrA|nr:GtrA family protein [Puia sp.]
MITFTKAQLASILATGVDFLVTFLLLRLAGLPSVAASGRITLYGVMGTICGGVTHFMISRHWVFNARDGRWAGQVNRYVLVWIGSLALNAAGLYLLSRAGCPPMFAKVITASAVAVGYNYTLQKRFVFNR